jgi:hypothetical protein
VAGMGPQGKLDDEEYGQEERRNADDKRSQSLFSPHTARARISAIP